MAIVECQGCGRRVFLVRSQASLVRCPRCGEPLVKEEDTTEIERRVRQRLYGASNGDLRGGAISPREKRRSEPRRRDRVGSPWRGRAGSPHFLEMEEGELF
jgi:predicted RNA-binding Zn-ribbon protein involved in translation (DUF1610 family)